MVAEDKVKKYRRFLYVACRNRVADRFKDDPEEVKYYLDNITEGLLHKSFTECNAVELEMLLYYVNNHVGQSVKRCSVSQRRMLTFYQLHYAIAYAEWGSMMYKVDTRTLSGMDLRNYVYHKIEKREKMPLEIYRHFHERYINPKAHEFLIEGGFKTLVKNSKNLHYEYLTPEEANYLIQRFAQIYLTLTKEHRFDTVEHLGALN